MKTPALRSMALSAIDQLDEAVLGILRRSNIPLYPKEISIKLNIPRSFEIDLGGRSGATPVYYPTVRDSLFRLLKKRKVKRTLENRKTKHKWYAV